MFFYVKLKGMTHFNDDSAGELLCTSNISRKCTKKEHKIKLRTTRFKTILF